MSIDSQPFGAKLAGLLAAHATQNEIDIGDDQQDPDAYLKMKQRNWDSNPNISQWHVRPKPSQLYDYTFPQVNPKVLPFTTQDHYNVIREFFMNHGLRTVSINSDIKTQANVSHDADSVGSVLQKNFSRTHAFATSSTIHDDAVASMFRTRLDSVLAEVNKTCYYNGQEIKALYVRAIKKLCMYAYFLVFTEQVQRPLSNSELDHFIDTDLKQWKDRDTDSWCENFFAFCQEVNKYKLLWCYPNLFHSFITGAEADELIRSGPVVSGDIPKPILFRIRDLNPPNGSMLNVQWRGVPINKTQMEILYQSFQELNFDENAENVNQTLFALIRKHRGSRLVFMGDETTMSLQDIFFEITGTIYANNIQQRYNTYLNNDVWKPLPRTNNKPVVPQYVSGVNKGLRALEKLNTQ